MKKEIIAELFTKFEKACYNANGIEDVGKMFSLGIGTQREIEDLH